jgi:hypothetical protein
MQSTDPDYAWAVTVIIFYLKLLFGVVGVVLSICWLLQILLYIFVYPPVTPFLNTLFTDLDNAFPLFGTVAFGIFCFYLIGKPSTSLIALPDCMLAMWQSITARAECLDALSCLLLTASITHVLRHVELVHKMQG